MTEDSGKLDLSVLSNLNFQGAVAADSGVIKTVNSIEDFNEDEPTKVVTPEDEGDIETDEIQEDEGSEYVEYDGDESPIKVWAEFAAERGLIDLDKDEKIEDSEEFLVKKFNDRIDSVFNEYKKSLPDPLRELLDAHDKGVPIEDLMEADSRIMEFSAISSEKLKEDTELQKNIVKAYLKSQEFEDDEIEAKIEKYEDNILLEDEAASALKKLVKSEQRHKESLIKEAEEFKKQREKQYTEDLKHYTDSVMNLEEIIPGIPVTKEQKETIVKMTTRPVAVLKNGMQITALDKMRLEDPNFLPKLAYIAGVLNWDLSAIERKATTAATRKVKNGVNSTYTDKSPLSKLDLKTIRRAVKQSNNRLFK